MRVMRRIAGSILQQTHILQTLKRLMGGGICLFLLIASLEVTAQTMPDVNGSIWAIAPDDNGGIYIGGSFTTVGGIPRTNVAHIFANGTVDVNWNPAIVGQTIQTLAISNSTLYLGGSFTTVNGVERKNIAAVHATTGAVLPFAVNNYLGSQVTKVIVHNGKLYFAGYFTSIAGQIRKGLAAVDAVSGNLLSFNANLRSYFVVGSTQYEQDVLPNSLIIRGNTLYIGGDFNEASGQPCKGIVALDATSAAVIPFPAGAEIPEYFTTAILGLHPDYLITRHYPYNINNQLRKVSAFNILTGTHHATWNPNINNSIFAFLANQDASYIGGSFSTVGTAERVAFAGIDMVTGTANQYNPIFGGTASPIVNVIEQGSNNVLYVGGQFSTVNGYPQTNLAALAFPPKFPVTAITFGNQRLDGTGAVVSWTPPSGGSAGYTVVAIEGAEIPNGIPQNGDVYTGTALFTGATNAPFNGQVVYDGSATSFSVTGLIPNTNYTFVIFPYNGNGASRVYFTQAPPSVIGRTNPPPPPSVIVHPGIITVSSATINFGDVALNTSRTRRYTMYCANLTTANVTIAAPPQCEISVAGAPFSAAPVVFTTRATIDQVDIRVRFTPSVNGNLSGGITHTAGSTGATATLTGTSSPPSINASTLSLDFGAVVPSSTATRTYRVRYRNLASRSITLTPPPGFALSTTGTAPYSSAPLTVPTGVSGGFNVYAQFSPPNVGQINGNIGIANLDAPPLAVLVEGEGAYPRPGLAIQSLNFGDVPVGTCKLMSYVLTPAGPIDEQLTVICPVALSDVEISTNGPNGPFSSGCQAIVFSRLAGVTSVRIWVRYCPTAVSDLNTTFSHTSQPGGQFVQLPITGRGVAPEITVLTPTINFGDVDLGSTAASVVRIRYRNVTPTGTITISTTASHPFLFDNLISGVRTNLVNFSTSATSSGATFSVRVTFAPTLAGPVRTTLSTVLVAPNGVTTASFTLIGRGIGASLTANNKRALDFGSQFLLVPRTLSFPLQYSNITTNTITVTPPNHNNFLLMDPGTGVFSSTAGITLTVGGNPLSPATGTTTLTARFLPVQANGNPVLTFRSTVADGGIAATETLALRGTGLVPMVNVTIGTIQFGQVDLGQVRYYRYTMTYRNITASTISIDIPVGSDFALAESSSGTWTTAGQRLSLTTVQPPTSATTTVSFWVRYTPTIAQATSIMVRHSSDGGDPRTVDGDNLVLAARKPSVLLSASVSGVHFGVIAANSVSTQTFSLNYTNIGSPIVLTLPLGISARLAGSNAAFTARSFAFTPPAFSGSSAIEVQYSTTANATLNANISCTAFGTGATLVAVAGRAFTPQPTISFNPPLVSFGTMVAGFTSTASYTITYQNVSGLITLHLPTGIKARAYPGDSFQDTFISFLPDVRPNGTWVIELQCAPTAAGVIQANVEHLRGSAPTFLPVQALVLPNTAFVQTVPASLNLGQVREDKVSTTQTYTVRYGNLTASGNLTVSPPATSGIEVAVLPDGLFKTTTSASLQTGAGTLGEVQIAVRYAPPSSTHTLSVNIAHTVTGIPTANLAVSGSTRPKERMTIVKHVYFAGEDVGGTYTSTYTLTYAYLTTNTITLRISDRHFIFFGQAPRFAVSVDGGTTFIDNQNTILSLPANAQTGSMTFTVRFKPVAVGARLATVTHDANGLIAEAYLYGVGKDPNCSVIPSPTLFAAKSSGASLSSVPGGPSDPPTVQTDPTRSVVVYLLQGVQKTTDGKALRIADGAAVRTVLTQYNITDADVKPYLPDFSGNNVMIDEGPDNKIKLMDYSNMLTITAADSLVAHQLATALTAHPDVLSASQGSRAITGNTDVELNPNDPYMNNRGDVNRFFNQSGMDEISMRKAWNLFQGDPTLAIGIFDLGIDKNHEDLGSKVIGPVNEFEDPYYIDPVTNVKIYYADHGTSVAYIAAGIGNNCIGAAGVDWNAKLFSYPIDHSGISLTKSLTSDKSETQNMFVTNHSYHNLNARNPSTGRYDGTQYNKAVRTAFALAYKSNRLSVTIMHNYADPRSPFILDPRDPPIVNPIIYPAAYKGNGNIATGAIGPFENRASTSGYHPYIDVAAPSYNVISATPKGYNGFNRLRMPYLLDPSYLTAQTAPTSNAAPMVSGLATLVKGYARKVKNNFELDNDDVENIIKLSAEPLPGKIDDETKETYGSSWNKYIGHGRINAYKALVMVRDNTIEHKMTQPNLSTWHEESTPYTLEVRSTPPANLRDDTYKVRRYEMRTTITLPSTNAKIWGRGAGKESWGVMAEDTIPSDIHNTIQPTGEKVQYGMGGCEVVPGSRNGTSVTLRTYIYKVEETKGNIMQGTWFPCAPQDVRYYYTVMNTTSTLVAQSLEKSATLSSQGFSEKRLTRQNESVSQEPTLLAIYPNPGNASVNIDFELSTQSLVSFEVMNVLGRQVYAVPEQLYHKDSHTLQYRTNDLTNGIYTLIMKVRDTDSGLVHYHTQRFTILH